MKLPNIEKAVVPKAKITDYLLYPTHRSGCSKAKFFMRFRFSAEPWEICVNALKRHAADNEVVKIEASYFGTKYVIEGTLFSLDERKPTRGLKSGQ